jgi:hypothetical protein
MRKHPRRLKPRQLDVWCPSEDRKVKNRTKQKKNPREIEEERLGSGWPADPPEAHSSPTE